MDSMTVADYLAISDKGEKSSFSGSGAFLWIILIFLFFLAFTGGWGNLGGRNNDGGIPQMERELLQSSATNLQTIYNTSCETQKEILQNRYDNAMAIANLGYQTQQCCCETQKAIHAEGEETRALIQANTIQSLRDQLNTAATSFGNLQLAQNIVNQVRPFPQPAYITCSPYTSNCGCGCNGTTF